MLFLNKKIGCWQLEQLYGKITLSILLPFSSQILALRKTSANCSFRDWYSSIKRAGVINGSPALDRAEIRSPISLLE